MKNKSRVNDPKDSMAIIQGRLQELLDQGRLLRQQIESIATDVDFPLTRDSDGDPRLRDHASRPDPPLRQRARKRGGDKRR